MRFAQPLLPARTKNFIFEKTVAGVLGYPLGMLSIARWGKSSVWKNQTAEHIVKPRPLPPMQIADEWTWP